MQPANISDTVNEGEDAPNQTPGEAPSEGSDPKPKKAAKKAATKAGKKVAKKNAAKKKAPAKKKKAAKAAKAAAPADGATDAAAAADADGEAGTGAEPVKNAAKKKAAKKSKKKAAKKTAKKKAPKKAKKSAKKKAAKKAGDKPAKKGGRRRYQVPPNPKGKDVVIVESPAKARTINRYLGDEYVVAASMGHVRDLPKSKLGVDPENNFAVTYVPIADRDETLEALRKMVKNAKTVYLAPDPDREGEAIAWHLVEALELTPEQAKRVTFNEVTKKAILAAFEKPTELEMDRVYAQQARRVLDRVVGYYLSPLLWSKLIFGLSAGRVQSVSVRMIVEREREIRAFRPDEYWNVVGKATGAADRELITDFALKEWDGAKVAIKTGDEAEKIAQALRASDAVVKEIKRTERTEKARPPFTTSTLQQQSSIRLRFPARKTMRLAQQLYEGLPIGEDGPTGLITYMRTDSVRIGDEAKAEVRQLILDRFGKEFVPDAPNSFKENSKAQAAHEAIRPTSALRTPEVVSRYVNADQLRLYTMIWQRLVASQMSPATIATTQVKATVAKGMMQADGREVLFAGHQAALKPQRSDTPELPSFTEGETLDVHEIIPSQHFTQPPPRFSEATLVKQLEKNGIGRPSTYAPIISTITARGYVRNEKRRFHATPIGELVTDLLVKHFPDILSADFTSNMESQLDQIEAGEVGWVEVLTKFHDMFAADMERAKKEMRDYKKNPDPADYDCPACGNKMVYRVNKRGKYLGCGTYPECDHTIPLDEEGTPVEPKVTDLDCPVCPNKMILRYGRQGSFLGCGGYPDCTVTLPVDDEGNPLFADRIGEICPECKKPMIVRSGRRGPFLACTGYPECESTKPLGEEAERPDPKIDCEECGKKMTWRRGRRGLFLGCTGYPECKTTKPAPKVSKTERAEAVLAEVSAPIEADEPDSELAE